MMLLQEGMAAGPYALGILLILLIGIALVIYSISLLIKYNRPEKEKSDIAVNKKQEFADKKNENKSIPWGVNSFLIIFLAVLLWGIFSLLKWSCSVTLD